MGDARGGSAGNPDDPPAWTVTTRIDGGTGMDVLDEAAIKDALRQLPGWELTRNAIAKLFVHESFRLAMQFVQRIGDSTEGAAEVAGQHPWIDIRANLVTVAIPLRSGNTLTPADIVLARRIDGIGGAHEHPPGLASPY